jgi:uncharacterized delta-60 repeat protein
MNYNKQINVISGKLLLTIFVTFLAFNISFAADGDLDLTFNGNGKAITQIGDATDDAKASVIQNDGKIVVAGWSYCCMLYPSKSSFAVARYNTDGSLDNSFGDYGKVTTEIGTNSWAYAVAIQPDGKIVVAGASNGIYNNSFTFTLVRYNANGTIDDSFGEKGIVMTSEILNSDVLGVAIQQDGKIVAVGNSYQPFGNTIKSNLAIARYNSDGSIDTSFDNDGIIISQDTDQGNFGYSVAIQSDGKILTYTAFGIYRYNSDGSFDVSFGNQGKVIFDYGQSGNSKSLVIQPDGKIVAAASVSGYFNAVLRFNYDGTPDLSFNRTGAVSINVDSAYGGASVAVQSDLKIVVAQVLGGCSVIIRFNSDGRIDATYDGDGRSLNCYQYDTVQQVSVATQPDLKIVTTIFFSYNQPYRDFAVERHNNDGSYDTEFGSNGQVRTGDFTGNAYMTSMAMQPDGKIIATGFSNVGQDGITPFLVARYNTNGTLDNSFGIGGKVRTAIGTPFSYARAKSVAVQTDGKIVVAGEATEAGCSNCFAVIRYNQNGSLDTSFDNDGIVLTQIIPGLFVNSVFIQPDGKIIVNGYQSTIRYNADGSLDASFGNNGILTYQNNMFARASSLQNDGKIVVGGNVFLNSTTYFGVSRYNSDGSIDASFGENGQVLVRVEDYSELSTLKIQPDGKIVALGRLSNKYTIIRYNSDGSLDNTFAVNGKLITKNAGSSFEFQQNGKIIFAGNRRGGFLGIRLNADGSSDNSFVANTETIGKSSSATKILIQPDGKIVVGGSVDGTFGLMRYQGTPIAVNAGISGRITTASGHGIQNVSVQISGGNLSESKLARTNTFGYYRFQDLQVGQTYIVGVSAKRYSFVNPIRVITLNEDLTGEDFVSNDK